MNQFLPHPDVGPPLHPELSHEQRIAAWIDLMEFGDVCFMAGLQHRLALGKTPVDAARESYSRYVKEQDEKLMRMARRFGGVDGR